MNMINIAGQLWHIADLIPLFFASVMIVSMVWYWRQPERWHIVPSMLTGLGILGTFIGIIVGLWDFDVNNVVESVPTLLSGLKTAFITSILGMSFSLFWKVIKVPASASSIKKQQGKKEVDIVQQIDRVVSAITGTEDSSLITQIQRMRTDITDQFKTQNKTMETMLDAISKNNTELLIESLRTVVEDFDSKINERLGQTFDDLAKAAVNLVEWQSNHKQQMVDLIDQYRELSDKLELSINHQTAMTDQTSRMESLAGEMLDVSGEVRRMADSVVSTTSAANDWLTQSVEQLESNTGNMITKLESHTDNVIAQLESNTGNMIDTAGKLIEEVEIRAVNVVEQTESYATNMFKLLETNSINAIEKMESHTDNVIAQLESNTGNVVDQIKSQTSKTLETYGSHLVTLSHKLTDDYGPLVDKLQQLNKVSADNIR